MDNVAVGHFGTDACYWADDLYHLHSSCFVFERRKYWWCSLANLWAHFNK